MYKVFFTNVGRLEGGNLFQTFDDESKIDIQVIRELIDEDHL